MKKAVLLAMVSFLVAWGCAEQENRVPVAVLDGPESGVVDEALSFDASGSYDVDGSIVKYSFDFGDGTIVEDAPSVSSHTYSSEGVYTVIVTVSDNDGGTSTATRQVVVTPNQPPVAVLSGPPSGVVGETLTFGGSGSSDPDGIIATYDYDFGDGSSTGTVTDTSVNHTYGAAGTYTVALTVTDNDGGTNITTREITIYTGAQANPDPVASFNGPTMAFTNEDICFDAFDSYAIGGTITQYEFDFDNDAVWEQIGPSPIGCISYTSTGTYTVILRVTATYLDASTNTNTAGRNILITQTFVSVASISPNSGSVGGGEAVTITGVGFTTPADTIVTIGGNPATNITVVDSTIITAFTPPGVPGSADVVVSNSNGTGILPDGYTYFGANNLATTEFCPEDASTGGICLPFAPGDDDASLSTTLPFDFLFYGTLYPAGSTIYITSNGWMSFTDSGAAFNNNPIPDPNNPDNMIAPFFFDLNIGASGQVCYQTSGAAPNRRFSIEWDGVTDNLGLGDTYTFELVLYEFSNDIKFQYLNDVSNIMAGAPPLAAGVFATIGLQENQFSGDEALFSNFEGGLAPGGRVYVFRYEPGAYTLLKDTTLSVSSVSPNNGGEMLTGDNFTLSVSKMINSTTAVADITVKLDDLTTASPVNIDIWVGGPQKSIVTGAPWELLVWGHTYQITATSGLEDVLGNPLSQDPYQVSCGVVGAPTNFTSTFMASPGFVQTSGGLPGGGDPMGIAITGTTAIVTKAFGADRVQSYDTDSLANLDNIGVGNDNIDVAINPTGTTAYVTSSSDGTLMIIDITDPANLFETAASPINLVGPGPAPWGLTILPNGNKAFVTDLDISAVHVIDTSAVPESEIDTDPITPGVQPILLPGCDPFYIASTPDNTRVYVTCSNDDTVMVIDTSTYGILDTINLPIPAGPLGIIITPDGSKAYVVNNSNETMSVIDTDPLSPTYNQIIATVSGFSAGADLWNTAVTSDGRYVLVTDMNNDEVAIINTLTDTISYIVGGFDVPFDLAVVSGTYRVLVTNQGDDRIRVIQ